MDKKPYPSETQERFIVRLPDGMRDKIAAAAKASGRSMNAEIVARLQESFELTDDVNRGSALTLPTGLIKKIGEQVEASVKQALREHPAETTKARRVEADFVGPRRTGAHRKTNR
ncbi:Arc family DNA-binding protein [Paraburkholderia tuberum]|uniref:Arc-like DNA binding domain-containing protein n=1 Tax=Paraburkholderia tuberum TaxID=157910 RepID=A0A1H1GY36_9BURK|nr:Arc family DNA-binding protein [Paraburkholderia tuberum]SDR18104.1 Arc-like DNA binding domain-containing protein [Paraburkholderia tuberum]